MQSLEGQVLQSRLVTTMLRGLPWSVVPAAGGADVVVLGAADSVFGMKEAAAGL